MWEKDVNCCNSQIAAVKKIYIYIYMEVKSNGKKMGLYF